MKKRASTLSNEEKIKTLDTLYTAAASVKGRSSMKLFLRDLLTESERIMLGRRIWIARLILRGDKIENIAKTLKVSFRTIYNVRRWLTDHIPGYEEAIRGVEAESDRRALVAEAKADPFSYAAMKRKYPLYFLLFPVPKAKEQYRKHSL